MTEKIPPVLSVDRIGEIVGGCKQWWEIPAKVAVAQRDADAAYYEPLIKDMYEALKMARGELCFGGDWETAKIKIEQALKSKHLKG